MNTFLNYFDFLIIMKLFSDCAGKCLDCAAYYVPANCLAGHGDDHFSRINPDTARQILSDGVLYK